MPYCMCKENFDYCNCDQHICPKHKKKVTDRPAQVYDVPSFVFTSPTLTLDSDTTSTTGTFQ